MKKIVLDCEKMRYPNTGFYFFCKNLANSLINQNNKNLSLSLYLPENEIANFSDYPQRIKHSYWYRYYFPTKNNIDIWHSCTQMSRIPPLTKNTRLLLTIHDLNVLYEQSGCSNSITQQLRTIQRKIDRADQIVTISQYVKQDILRNLNTGNKPISVIYNGCNIPDQKTFRAPLKLPEKPFLFAIGAINAKKNFHVLTSLLVANDYNLVISGITDDEHYRQKIISEAKKLNVLSRVILTGAISDNDKYWYFQNCTAFLFPSLAEGFGLPVVEAMYFGKPVFLSTLTSLPEIGGECAFYFDNFESEAMQQVFEQGMTSYNANPAVAQELKKRAATFNWNTAATLYLNVYNQL